MTDKDKAMIQAIPPNIRKLAEQIHKKRNPKKITAAICGMTRLESFSGERNRKE